jgi:hypothetical protein
MSGPISYGKSPVACFCAQDPSQTAPFFRVRPERALDFVKRITLMIISLQPLATEKLSN